MCPLNPLGMPLYLVVDTESSVRLNDRCRVLVSLAYEVVDTVGAPSDSGSIIRASGYDIVHQSADLPLDPISLRVHRIDGPTSRSIGRPLRTVLADLAAIVRTHRPTAVVGHDVRGDVSLLVSECLRVRLDPRRLFGELFGRLVCTKLASAVPCGIPLPLHLCYRFPCDPYLLWLNTGGEGDPPLGNGGPPPPRVVRLKWPNLAESFDCLVLPSTGGGPPDFSCHDARGDVERCRAVFLRLLSWSAARS